MLDRLSWAERHKMRMLTDEEYAAKYRERHRQYKYKRYQNDPDFRKKQIEYASSYQTRMWYSSSEYRETRTFQRKNPLIPPIKGRPRFDGTIDNFNRR